MGAIIQSTDGIKMAQNVFNSLGNLTRQKGTENFSKIEENYQ